MRVPCVAMMAMVAAVAVVGSTSVAHADERIRARLTYAPDPEIERCPTEREVKDAVASRLGYDPFVATTTPGAGPTEREVVVKVRRRSPGIVGSLELRGPRPGQRELASPRGDCREVIDAFAVAIAIGIDPSSLTRPPPEAPATAGPGESAPPPAPAPAPSAPPPAPAADVPVPASKGDPVDLRLGAGPLVLFGELPATAPALAVSFGARWKGLEPRLEGLASLPVSRDASPGRVTASLLALALVPCGHVDVFFGCLGVTVGALRGEGEGVASPLHGSQLYAAASARAGAELPLSRVIWVGGYAEVVAPMTRITLQLAAQDVWSMPSVAARVGASLGVLF